MNSVISEEKLVSGKDIKYITTVKIKQELIRKFNSLKENDKVVNYEVLNRNLMIEIYQAMENRIDEDYADTELNKRLKELKLKDREFLFEKLIELKDQYLKFPNVLAPEEIAFPIAYRTDCNTEYKFNNCNSDFIDKIKELLYNLYINYNCIDSDISDKRPAINTSTVEYSDQELTYKDDGDDELIEMIKECIKYDQKFEYKNKKFIGPLQKGVTMICYKNPVKKALEISLLLNEIKKNPCPFCLRSYDVRSNRYRKRDKNPINIQIKWENNGCSDHSNYLTSGCERCIRYLNRGMYYNKYKKKLEMIALYESLLKTQVDNEINCTCGGIYINTGLLDHLITKKHELDEVKYINNKRIRIFNKLYKTTTMCTDVISIIAEYIY
jgi:hypothetical protein